MNKFIENDLHGLRIVQGVQQQEIEELKTIIQGLGLPGLNFKSRLGDIEKIIQKNSDTCLKIENLIYSVKFMFDIPSPLKHPPANREGISFFNRNTI